MVSIGVQLNILNSCDHHGYSPLHYAAYADEAEIAKKLIAKKTSQYPLSVTKNTCNVNYFTNIICDSKF